MTQFVEKRISEIGNKEFHTFLAEFCDCLDWDPLEFQNKSLANLFSAIEMQGKIPNLNLIPCDSILSKKIRICPLILLFIASAAN